VFDDDDNDDDDGDDDVVQEMTNCQCLVTWVDIVGSAKEVTSNVAKHNTIKDYVSAGVNGFKLVNT
jgi:hypothetical protein